ncbi:enoyl-CoA hydratase/carnithine racemase [Rhodococcus opacus]|nr:enoyl-CoA hydratase/carnithine racemase [Rhodococcus opacus]
MLMAGDNLLTTGRVLTAGEARNFGLVNQIAEPTQTLDSALAVALRWTDILPEAMIETKKLFNTMCDLTPTGAEHLAIEATQRLWRPHHP